jgi:prepilin-type N-terminal cleavage/methylation domain-containing protein
VTRRSVQGYTLIELIVVMVLVGLMGTLALPRLRHTLLSDDLKGSTRRLAGMMRELRGQAQRDQKDFFLRFDLDSGIYWVESRDMNIDDRSFARENGIRIQGDVRISDIWLKGEGTISSGDASITITRKGYVQPSAIHLTDDTGREFTLSFRPFLPKERFYDEYIDFREW